MNYRIPLVCYAKLLYLVICQAIVHPLVIIETGHLNLLQRRVFYPDLYSSNTRQSCVRLLYRVSGASYSSRVYYISATSVKGI